MGDYCSILLCPRLQSLNKYILFCPRLLSFESKTNYQHWSTRTNSAVWQVPHACAQPNHPGSGSHRQLFLPYQTLLELISMSGIRTGEPVSQRPFTSESSANVSSIVGFEILVSPAQQEFPIELYIRRKLEREQQTKSRGKRATQAKKSPVAPEAIQSKINRPICLQNAVLKPVISHYLNEQGTEYKQPNLSIESCQRKSGKHSFTIFLAP